MNKRAVAMLELGAAAGLIATQHAAYRALSLRENLLDYGAGAAERLSGHELVLFGVLLVGVPAIWLVADAIQRLRADGDSLARLTAHARTVALAASAFATLSSIAIAWLAFDHAVFTDDERTYLFQARALLDGGFTARIPEPALAFPNHFLLDAGDGTAGGLFPTGQPALLTIGLRLGMPHLTQSLAVGVTVWTTARFAARQWDERTSLLVAMLLATSPMLVMVSSTLHNIVPTVMCVAIVLYATCAFAETGAAVWGGVIGAACGLALCCRPLDGTLLGLFALVRVVATGHSHRRRLWTLALAILAGLPFLAFLLASYHAITGSVFESPYEMWLARDWPRARMFGFGPAAFGYDHTVGIAVHKTGSLIVRMMTWSFGWPLSLLPLWWWIRGRGRDRATNVLAALAGAHAIAYFACSLASVHDFGSYYHVYALPLIAVISARAILALEMPAGRSAVRLAMVATVVGALTVWPMQLQRLSFIADRISGPLRAADAASDGQPVIVLHAWMHPSIKLGSWVFFAPVPTPNADEPVLWARTGKPAVIRELLQRYPERRPLVMDWNDGAPTFSPLPQRFFPSTP